MHLISANLTYHVLHYSATPHTRTLQLLHSMLTHCTTSIAAI